MGNPYPRGETRRTYLAIVSPATGISWTVHRPATPPIQRSRVRGPILPYIPPVGPITPTTPGYGYSARTRTARAIPTVIPPVAPPPSGGSPPSPGAPNTPPINLSVFGIPRVSETFLAPQVRNGLPYAGVVSISGVTTANPGVVNTSTGHGLLTGDQVTITGVAGATQANGTWTITYVDATHFSIPVNVTGTYSSGGLVKPQAFGTPWRPNSVTRGVWANQLQVVIGGQDVTFFRGIPTEVVSWESQDPFGDASAVIDFPQIASFDSLFIPPALAIGEVVGIAATYTGNGYWQVSASGVVTGYGDAALFGDALGVLNAPISGIAAHPSDYGYVLCAEDGGVFAFGASPFCGSLPGSHVTPAGQINGICSTASGNGYWMVGADGGVFAFGDATYHGNAVGSVAWPSTAGAIGIARAGGGGQDGYIILTTLGAIFAIGPDAVYHGAPSTSYIAPLTGVATSIGVDGYTCVNSVGAAYAFGSATYRGGVNPQPLAQPMNSITTTPSDLGYWMSAGDGGVFAFGNAVFLGSQPSGGLPNSGSLSWLRLGAPVTINYIDPSNVVHTLWEGVVADFKDGNAPGVQVQCVGVIFQCDWYLAKPIVSLPFVGYDPNTGDPIFGWDAGTAIANALNSPLNPGPGTAIGAGPQPTERGSPYTGHLCTPVQTGILTTQRGSWDKLATGYVNAILAQTTNAGGRQYTVKLARPRTPVIALVNNATADWTVWTGGHGVDTSGLDIDQTTAANAIYGTGTSPTTFSTVGATSTGMAAQWSGAKYPRLPTSVPAFPLTPPNGFNPGDGQTGFQPFSDWLRLCGYPLSSQNTYLATNVPANILDQALIQHFQQQASLQITGTVDSATWGAAFTAGTTAGSVNSVYYEPLAQLPQVEPYAYNPSGDHTGVNVFFNKRVPRVERYEQMGQNVSKGQGTLSATLELGRTQVPVWQGTIVLSADPAEGSRFQIIAGANIMLKSFHGRDVLLHISDAQIDFKQMTVTLKVSGTATALQTLAAIIARDTQAHGVQRQARPSLVTLNVSSSVITFDSESGAGVIPATSLVANGWTVIRVPFSEYGSVAELSLQTTPNTAFAMGVFSGPVTPGNLVAAFNNNSPLAAVPTGNGSNPWNFYAVALANLGLLYGAGGPNGPCGYWPSDPTILNPPLTGKYVDGSSWTYAPAPGYVPWLWVAFYALGSCSISGRMLPAPI